MKQTVSTFPALQTRNLEGQDLHLPADLQGKWNIVTVAFQRWQQKLIEDWLSHLTPLIETYPGLKIYEVPVIAGLYTVMRPIIDGGMARNIPNKGAREHTLTFYGNVRRVAEDLGLATTETIALFLVGEGGKVLWQGGGEYEGKQLISLEKVLKELGER